MKQAYSILLLLLICSCNVLGQCATTIPKSHKHNPPYFPYSSKSQIQYNVDRTLSVNIYVVANGFQSYDWDETDYMPDWEFLNELFEVIGMQFEICEEIQIPNYTYNTLSNVIEPGSDSEFDEEDEMLAQFYTENVINVYYVQTIINEPPAAGYAYFPGGPDVIVLEKGSGELTLAHEMGHFFGLYHTFETEFGLEFVNGDNCETTGDFVCDTPADNLGPVNGDCQYDAYITDANGDPYIPHINNIMSYYNDDCIFQFTAGQYNRMAWQYLTERNYLW
ncbi:MAG: M43 family zinc metalloprotease [Bacteroidota bacterium]